LEDNSTLEMLLHDRFDNYFSLAQMFLLVSKITSMSDHGRIIDDAVL